MESQSHEITASSPRPAHTVSRCPFHDGPLTLDLLLAELGADERPALDAALDLRCAIQARSDAAECVRLALRLRHLLEDRHYLAFYRVRLWLQRVVVVQVRAWRGDAWRSQPLPLNSARIDEIENACLAAWAGRNGSLSAPAQIRFVFRRPTVPSPVTAV